MTCYPGGAEAGYIKSIKDNELIGSWKVGQHMKYGRDIFITSLLSGSGLAVWALNLWLGFGVPV